MTDHDSTTRVRSGQDLKGERIDSPATYLHWGFILISVPNLIVIGAMIVLFAIALIAPFPHAEKDDDGLNK